MKNGNSKAAHTISRDLKAGGTTSRKKESKKSARKIGRAEGKSIVRNSSND